MKKNSPQRATRPYQNIFIIKPGAVGDLLQMTPVIRELKREFRSARITILVGSDASAGIFRNNPHVSECMIYDRRGRHRTLGAHLALWKRIRANRFDLVLNFQRSNIRTWLLATACIPCRILVYHKTGKRVQHAVQNYLETIAPLGITANDLHLEFFPDDPARKDAKTLLSPLGTAPVPLIALNPGASHPVNRWPARRFAEAADMLSETIAARIIIIGGSSDIQFADEILRRSRAHLLSLAGKTTIPQLGAVMELCDAVISGDTGPLHLATAVGTPAIALFGAADPSRTGPIGANNRVITAKGISCIPCRSRSCANQHSLACMEAITAQQVCEEVTGAVKQRGVRPGAV